MKQSLNLSKYIEECIRNRTRRMRLYVLMGVLCLAVAFGVINELMKPAITVTAAPICGREEHVHGETCFESPLICGLEEGDEHAHGGDCRARVLSCGLEEHTHGTACYPEELAEPSIEPTAEPTNAPTAEATVEPTGTPETTIAPDMTPEATDEATIAPEMTPEATDETTIAPEMTPEATTEATGEPLPSPEATAETAGLPVLFPIEGTVRLSVGEEGEWRAVAEGADALRYELLDASGAAIAQGEMEAENPVFRQALTASGLYTVRVTAENAAGVLSEQLTLAVTRGEMQGAASALAASCFGGDEAAFELSVQGGVEPITGLVEIWQGGELLYAGDAAGEVRAATRSLDTVSEIELRAVWTDACGQSVQAQALLPCAVRKTETRAEWERSFKDVEITEDWPRDLIEIARTQLGYQESAINFVLDDEGNRKGYTRYGDWYGADHSDWCAMFVSFCLHYAEIPQTSFPQEANCEKWIRALKLQELYAEAKEYLPESGDLVFYDWEGDGHADHVGLVEEVREGELFTLEGNSYNEVRRNQYVLDDECIIGYGLLNAAYQADLAMRPATEEPAPGESMEPTAEPAPEESAEPTVEPAPDESMEPTMEPAPGESAEPTMEPAPGESMEPTAEPAPGEEQSLLSARIDALTAPEGEADEETLAAYEEELKSAAGAVLSLRETGGIGDEEALGLLEKLAEKQMGGPTAGYAALKEAIAQLRRPAEEAAVDQKIEYDSLCAALKEQCAQAWQAGEITKVEYQALKLRLESVPECAVECVYTALEGAVRVVHAESGDFSQEELTAERLTEESEAGARYLEEIDAMLALRGQGRVQHAALMNIGFTGMGEAKVTMRLDGELAASETLCLARRDEDGWQWLEYERLTDEEGVSYLAFRTERFSTFAALSLTEEARDGLELSGYCTQRGGLAALELCSDEGETLLADEEGLIAVQEGGEYLLRLRFESPEGFDRGAYFCAFDGRMSFAEAEGALDEEDGNWQAAGQKVSVSLDGGPRTAFMLELSVSFTGGAEPVRLGGGLMVRVESTTNLMGEMVQDDSAWRALCASGYFTYWSDKLRETEAKSAAAETYALRSNARAGDAPSDVQVVEEGGSASNGDGVVVSKTIAGTELENVFDITLTVQTPTEVNVFYEEPDMAVVIVMDISNTMTDNFGGVTRYQAAMTAAEDFLDKFAASNTGLVSKVGYVAFNTDAHEIFGLSSCSTASEANALKNRMRQGTGSIINASGYGDSHTRFTNVEAGLKLGRDLLASSGNANKYIIFLSDGFPTTYLHSGYRGWDPYCAGGEWLDANGKRVSGVFHDDVNGVHCDYGTSYSDEAAIRAREMAVSIKSAGMTIFSIGVDVGGQTVQQHVNNSYGKYFSVVDRTSTTYEIGDASSTESYKSWLRDSIGSGYYYDSTNTEGLKAAYDQIFAEIEKKNEAGSEAIWVTEDPIPMTGTTQDVEFIGFYDQYGALDTSGSLIGRNEAGGENTSSFASDKATIRWDLKQSGYTTTQEGNRTIYRYAVTYRVRLKNEAADFEEGAVYDTNDTTTLTYKTVKTENGQTVFSEQKTVDYPIPAVKGYLAELTFRKVETDGQPLAGAVFRLTHDTQACSACRGDGSSVPFGELCATSDAEGKVSFARVPSGHVYTLEETVTPVGFKPNGDTYSVEVAYDALSVTVTHPDGTTGEWSGNGEDTVVNIGLPRLPETGGTGTLPYTIGGCALMALSLLYGRARRRRREGRAAR